MLKKLDKLDYFAVPKNIQIEDLDLPTELFDTNSDGFVYYIIVENAPPSSEVENVRVWIDTPLNCNLDDGNDACPRDIHAETSYYIERITSISGDAKSVFVLLLPRHHQRLTKFNIWMQCDSAPLDLYEISLFY
jgi:hypothetical protein